MKKFLALTLAVLVSMFVVGSAYADKPTPQPDPGNHKGDVNSKSAGKVNDNRPAKVCDNGNSDCPTTPKVTPEPVKPPTTSTPEKPTTTATPVKPTTTTTPEPVKATSGNNKPVCKLFADDGLLGMTTILVANCQYPGLGLH